MDLFINNLNNKLNEENISDDDAKRICNMIQIADKTEECNIDVDIKKAELEKTQAEIKNLKTERFTKIGNLILTGVGTVLSVGALILINDRNHEAHRSEEIKYSSSEEYVERSILSKALDKVMRK